MLPKKNTAAKIATIPLPLSCHPPLYRRFSPPGEIFPPPLSRQDKLPCQDKFSSHAKF